MSLLCFQSAWPSSQSSHQYFAFNLHIQVGFCLIARSQNYTNLPDSWICGRLRVFAGVLRIFAGVLRVILGAVMCIYMRWCSGYENGLVCPCDAARMQAMFSHIQNVTCGDSVATRKQNRANYIISKIRRDSENWVILGHTPKLPKIIDRRNVQVFFNFRFHLEPRQSATQTSQKRIAYCTGLRRKRYVKEMWTVQRQY